MEASEGLAQLWRSGCFNRVRANAIRAHSVDVCANSLRHEGDGQISDHSPATRQANVWMWVCLYLYTYNNITSGGPVADVALHVFRSLGTTIAATDPARVETNLRVLLDVLGALFTHLCCQGLQRLCPPGVVGRGEVLRVNEAAVSAVPTTSISFNPTTDDVVLLRYPLNILV